MTHPFSSVHQSRHATRSAVGDLGKQFSDLVEAKLPIPAGYIVSSVVFEAFLSHHDLNAQLLDFIATGNVQDIESLTQISKSITHIIMHAPIPLQSSNAILEALVSLNDQTVMMHASLIGSNEPGPSAYGYIGEANIFLGIRKLWCSLFTPAHILEYSLHQVTTFPSIAICIQQQPKTLVSGILYTTDQGSAHKHTCVVHAVFGEGGYTGNLLGKDVYWVSKQDGSELDFSHTSQENSVVFENGTQKMQPLSPHTYKQRKLSKDQLVRISELAKKLQQHCFFPQECSFCFDGKKFFIIQTKSIGPTVETFPKPSYTPSTVSDALIMGKGSNPGIVTGHVKIVLNKSDAASVKSGDIVVAPSFESLDYDVFKKARGLVIEEDVPASEHMVYAHRFGLATIVGAKKATSVLSTVSHITLHSKSGTVTLGNFHSESRVSPSATMTPHMPATKIGIQTSLLPGLKSTRDSKQISGHLLISPEDLITLFGHHPHKLASQSRSHVLTHEIVESIKNVTNHSSNSYHLIYKISDLTTKHYSGLSGARIHETHEETNPLMGYHGALRHIKEPQIATIELEAIKQLRTKDQYKDLWIALPSIRYAHEYSQMKQLLEQNQLSRGATLKYLLYVTIPSIMWQIEECIRLGLDGVVLDIDAISGFLFAQDPHNEHVVSSVDDQISTLKSVLLPIITICQEQGIRVIMNASKMVSDPLIEFAVHVGIHEIIVPEALLEQTSERLLFYEASV